MNVLAQMILPVRFTTGPIPVTLCLKRYSLVISEYVLTIDTKVLELEFQFATAMYEA